MVLNNIQQSLGTVHQRLSQLEHTARQGPIHPPQSSHPHHVPPMQDASLAGTSSTHEARVDQQSAAEIARRVREQLETSGFDSNDEDEEGKPIRRGKKSGRSRTTKDFVVKEVSWPHFGVYQGRERAPATYESLTIQEFVLGYLIQAKKEKSPKHKDIQMRHLQNLMLDACSYPWQNVRNFHAVLLSEMEQDSLTWDDEDTIACLRRTYSHVAEVTATTNSSTVTVNPNTKHCDAFQSGTCSQRSDHEDQQHICAWCLVHRQKACRHSESKCFMKTRTEAAKNK